MSIANVRTWLASRAKSIRGMHGYPQPGQSFTFPCIVFDWSEPAANYVEAGTISHWFFKAYLLVAAYDPEKGYQSLDEYIDKAGGMSVSAALEGDRANMSFNGDVFVRSCDSAGPVTYRGQSYYGAEFSIEVVDTA